MITGIVMAAGFSKRMGENKLLMEVGGCPLVKRVMEAASLSSLDRLVLVYRDQEVRDLGLEFGMETVYNPRSSLGQSESMRLGIEKSPQASDYMFLVGDQPYLDSGTIDQIIDCSRSNSGRIIVPYYGGKRGMPTIFPNIYREELLATRGDQGGRDLIRSKPCQVLGLEIADVSLGLDLDTREEYRRFKGEFRL